MKQLTKIISYLYLIFFLSACATHSPANEYEVKQFHQLYPNYVLSPQVRLEYYQVGTGSPIVFIPGYATDATSWDRYFLAELAKNHRLIILNNRNVGKSLALSSHYQSKDLANDIDLLIRQLNLKKPAVVGISMGGMIAQQLAVSHPNAVGQLILINTMIAGKQSVRPTQEAEAILAHMPHNQLGFYLAGIELFSPPGWKPRMAFALAFNRFIPAYYTSINYNTVMPEQKELIMRWLNDNDTAIKLRRLSMPVLIQNGKSDILIPPENSVILANTIPHAKLLRYDQGGHAMIYQFPEKLGNDIHQFIVSHKH